MLVCCLLVKERRWTGPCAHPPRILVLCFVRCLAHGTASSAIGHRGLRALRRAPARPRRGSRWGCGRFWPITLGKVCPLCLYLNRDLQLNSLSRWVLFVPDFLKSSVWPFVHFKSVCPSSPLSYLGVFPQQSLQWLWLGSQWWRVTL